MEVVGGRVWHDMGESDIVWYNALESGIVW